MKQQVNAEMLQIKHTSEDNNLKPAFENIQVLHKALVYETASKNFYHIIYVKIKDENINNLWQYHHQLDTLSTK